jgi:type IV pilus assembly protein PilB
MAQSQGMVTMRQDGYLKALAGGTTINEVNRVAAEGGG